MLQSKKTEIISSLGNDFSKLKKEHLEQEMQQNRKSELTENLSSNSQAKDGSSQRHMDAISSNYASDISPISVSSSLDLNTDY